MKLIIRSMAILVLLALPAAMRAQLAEVTGGDLSMVFAEPMKAQLLAQGITLSAHNYRSWVKPGGFLVRSGVLDMATGAGEVSAHGGFHFAAGSTTLNLTEMQVDTSGPVPVVTALPVLNGVVQQRLTFATVIGGSLYKRVLVFGLNKTKDVYFAVDPGFWATLLTVFQLPVIVPVGTAGSLIMEVDVAPQTP